jgi:hypothetical protein
MQELARSIQNPTAAAVIIAPRSDTPQGRDKTHDPF